MRLSWDDAKAVNYKHWPTHLYRSVNTNIDLIDTSNDGSLWCLLKFVVYSNHNEDNLYYLILRKELCYRCQVFINKYFALKWDSQYELYWNEGKCTIFWGPSLYLPIVVLIILWQPIKNNNNNRTVSSSSR